MGAGLSPWEAKPKKGLIFGPVTTSLHLRARRLDKDIGMRTEVPFLTFYTIFIKDLLGGL